MFFAYVVCSVDFVYLSTDVRMAVKMFGKVLVTGANGFVARYLIEAMHARGWSVVGVDIAAEPTNAPDKYYSCNLLEASAIRDILAAEMPDHIVHLAAVSSVAQSWKAPVDSFLNNTNIFLNVAEAVRSLGLKTRILSVGSSEEYGNLDPAKMPIHESQPLNPCSPYAVARVSQEQLSGLYAKGFGLDIVMTRSFNQIGPGQRTQFVVPSFIQQLLDGKKRGESVVRVAAGDLTIVRDFLDVRDAVNAYMLLLDGGVSGEVYNVCSGVGHTLREVLEIAAEKVGVGLDVVVDPTRVRPADNHVIIGDNSKMRSKLGWRLEHDLESSISAMIEFQCGCVSN